MKVVIFSDVQANLPAMEAAVEQILDLHADLVIMDGDLVNRGPSSRACVETFDQLRRQLGWLPVKGNHEAWILRCLRVAPRDALEAQMRQFADWTALQVRDRLDALENWPDHLCFHGAHEASWVHVTHGTMAGNRIGITANLADEEIRGQLPDDIALFVTAHTHRPLERELDGVPILNVGSVGSPFDGDVRGSYAILEERRGRWHWEIVRFHYDRTRAQQDFEDSGFLEGGGPLTHILFEEWRQARLLMPLWRREFEPSVLAGERELAPAVEAFLRVATAP
ncbi:metallophosphoesterase [Thiocapsa imhoffii]|uniref:Metallophosphoesterase n=1 Tax=Thiocapsa imhoffii TaxID=382777 RepID=A0A9X1B916_9GAMM|nr:metallophosphoesterase family protein [Thiocapsa imhoffii]MBK1644586.1 metallophosphoesterase [Thiocapsa imhoffii]